MPPGIMQEQAHAGGHLVSFEKTPQSGHSVRRQGNDVVRDQQLIAAGTARGGLARGGVVTGKADWIAADWGTSNLRVWGIDASGGVSFARDSEQGMGRLTRDQYPAVLAGLLNDAPVPAGEALEVLICGMAGARQGWIEAPYLETPADLGRLGRGAVQPDVAGLPLAARILPGICQRSAGAEDVMRGEETQLLGLRALRPHFSGTVVMPGTHSKWVQLDGDRITRFGTAMTGELYEALGTCTVLRHSLAGEREGPATEDGIAAGLAAGLDTPGLLTSLLFRTRSAALLSAREPDWCAGYLSGLLVGAEVGGRRDWIGSETVPLLGAQRLCRLYGAALARIGIASEPVDATEATIAGLVAARRQGST